MFTELRIRASLTPMAVSSYALKWRDVRSHLIGSIMLIFEWETKYFSRENKCWDTENHEGGRSPTEGLRGTLKVLIESNLSSFVVAHVNNMAWYTWKYLDSISHVCRVVDPNWTITITFGNSLLYKNHISKLS